MRLLSRLGPGNALALGRLSLHVQMGAPVGLHALPRRLPLRKAFPRVCSFCQKPASVAFRLSRGIWGKASRSRGSVDNTGEGQFLDQSSAIVVQKKFIINSDFSTLSQYLGEVTPIFSAGIR